MKEFHSIALFIEHLAHAGHRLEHLTHKGLEAAAKLVEKDAKARIGTYQDAAGPFPQWAELADFTKEDRLRQGYTENDPLLRSGAMRDSIGHEVSGHEAVVGSESDIAMYQELGTNRGIPARPFLGPAVFENRERIEKIIGAAAVEGIGGAAHNQSYEL